MSVTLCAASRCCTTVLLILHIILNNANSADALALKFNNFLLFFPMSISELFSCHKIYIIMTAQNFRSEWMLKKRSYVPCCSLESKWESLCLPTGIWRAGAKSKMSHSKGRQPSTQQQNHQTFNDLDNYPQWACLMASRGRHQLPLTRLHQRVH